MQALVEGRECGTCDACCVLPDIDEPAFTKPAGVVCPNLAQGGGCRIYDTRPQTCRAYFCGWRLHPIVAEHMRPDRCGVMVMTAETATPDADLPAGLMFVVLTNRRALSSAAVLDTIGAALAAGIPCDLAAPGPPGFEAKRARLNARLAGEIERRDRAGTLSKLQAIYFELRARAAQQAPDQAGLVISMRAAP